MFYGRGKRHIGGEGRAHETGIPPTPDQESSPPSLAGLAAVDAGLGSAQKLPARPQTVTPGSIRELNRTRLTAFRESSDACPHPAKAKPCPPRHPDRSGSTTYSPATRLRPQNMQPPHPTRAQP